MMRMRLIAALSVVAVAPLAAADKLPPELALVPPDAAAFVSVRYDLLTASPLGKAPVVGELLAHPDVVKEVENNLLGFPPAEVERVTVVYPNLPAGDLTDAAPVFVVTRTKPIERGPLIRKFAAWPFAPDRDERRRPAVPRRGTVWQSSHDKLFCFAGDRTILLTTRRSAGVLLDMLARLVDPSPDAPLEPALAAAATGKNAVVVGATGLAFRQLVGLWPLHDKEFTALGRASAVTLVANLEPEFHLTVRATFRDQATAGEGQRALAGMTEWATDALKDLAAGPEKADADLSRLLLAAFRDAGEPVRDGKAVTLAVRMKADEFGRAANAFAQSAVTRIRTASARIKSQNNLQQMALAIHNFESTYGQFPFTDRPMGVPHPGLSWRVAILPYVEQDNLYKQFHLDEPWDSEHNKTLIDKMPKLFASPAAEAKPGHTFYRMFDGPGTMYQMKTLADVTDGTSNTFMIVEAGQAGIWTKPEELEYGPKKPLPKLYGHFPDGFCAALADGSVRFVRKGTDEKVLRALITANGGETVTLGKD